MITAPRNLFILLIISLALLSCSPVVRPEQLSRAELFHVTRGNSIGQTFFARFRGLSGIQVLLQPNGEKSGYVNLALFNDPLERAPRATSRIPLEAVTHPDFYTFKFPPQVDSENQDYYIEISLDSDTPLEVGIGPGDTYLNGAFYHQDVPQDKQLAFRLAYDPGQSALGLALLALSWSGILGIAAILFVLPGWALLGVLMPAWKERSWGEKLALAAGVSLAIYPILFLWADLAGLHLRPLYAWLPALAGAGALLWRNRRWPAGIINQSNLASVREWLYAIPPQNYLTLLIIALIVANRFWVIRNLSVPLWGDSYQHTMIAQLLVDNGGLFNSWQPYAELQTFTYHFGFHSLVAVFHWITNLPMPAATLWTGQILNILAVISLLPLAYKVGKSRWSGLLSLLLAGLLSNMPMVYLNWGRYTQLAGLVILPVAAYILWSIFENERLDWRSIGLTWILMGGLALTHYRVLVFGILFTVALFLFYSVGSKKYLIGSIHRLALSGIGAALIFTPWLIHVFRGKILQIFFNQVTTSPDNLSEFTQQYNAIGDLFTYLPALMWMLLPLALAWGFWRRERNFAILALWWLLVLLAANPQWFGLPGAGSITNFAVFISAYLPVTILLAAGLAWLIDEIAVSERIRSARIPALVLALTVALGLWGSSLRLNNIDVAQHALVTRPDLQAAEWIREHTPEDAVFLVNSFFAYGGTSVVGSDAGWWLPLLARRSTTLPPLTYASEGGPRPDYREWVNSLTAEILQAGIADPKVLDKLARRNVTHVYIGQQQGQVNYSGPRLTAAALQESSHFKEIYHQDRVSIFEFVR
jgi:hypothetical protein